MTRYKFKKPLNKCEEIEVLTLVEDRGDRVLVESNFTECCGAIVPSYVYLKSELVEIK